MKIAVVENQKNIVLEHPDRYVNGENLTEEEMKDILTPEKYIGRAPKQVEEFVMEYIKPIIESEEKYTGSKEMKV